ncbi:MAG: OmpA family protein [Deltaproteobacteria bacterium]|nr:OmpA family protein [Deltaproteobacteria bacterium]
MSNLNGEAQIQRIVKKKGHHGGHHGGAWKVAYADFVTAMMALFIVLWIMAQSQSIRQNVAQYFKNPGILPNSQGLMENSTIGGELPTPGHSQDLQRPEPAPADVVNDQKRLEETKKKIQEIIAQMPELENLKDQMRLEITDEGLRIELMEQEKSRFFEVGSASVNPQAQRIFGVISKELGGLPNHLTIEGHTDSRPYGRRDYTNWELSADRANAARRLMDHLGVKPGQISEVRGYADRRPLLKDPNDDRNRRVSIVVRALDKEKGIPLSLQQALAGPGKKIEPTTSAAGPAKPPLPAAPAPESAKIVLPVPGGAEKAKPEAAKTPPLVPPAPLPKPSSPPDQAKAAPPAPGAEKAKTDAAKTPPPISKESKPQRGPLEENLDLQKELLDLLPKFSPIK